jgi:SAM-dependent methyltransferase
VHHCYPKDYYTHATTGVTHDEGQRVSRVREYLRRKAIAWFEDDFVSRAIDMVRGRCSDAEAPRALDVGCGDGALLARLAKKGFSAQGLDWDPHAAAVARRNTGCAVDAGDFRTALLPSGAFELVVLHHVIEHLPNPREVLARARELIAHRGVILIVWPNPLSFGAYVFGPHWFAWDPPRHLVLPTRKSLEVLAEELGLHVIRGGGVGPFSARLAQLNSRNSRAYARALPATDTPPDRLDQLFATAEQAVARLGLGEEAVLLLSSR